MIDLTAKTEGYFKGDPTHIDYYYEGRTLSQKAMITDCVLLDISENPEKIDPDALKHLGRVKKGCSVLLKTGWERYRGQERYRESPSVDKALIGKLVEAGVCLILIDSPGVYGGAAGDEHNETDRYLADHEAYAVENLVNLPGIDTCCFRLYCFPIDVSGRNNALCRVLADV